jgi:hypothetical protein
MLPTDTLSAISERHLDKEATIEAPPAQATGAYGEPQPTGEWTVVAAGVPCRLAPQGSSGTSSSKETITDGQQSARQMWTIVFPEGTEVDASYRVTIDGRVFQIEGPAGRRSNEAMTKVTAVEYND